MKKQQNSGSRNTQKNASSTVLGKVVKKQAKFLPPRKPKNIERRTREHLSPKEMDRLINAARQIGRHSYRDATMILMAYRHGLRISELVSLRWTQVDLKEGQLHVNRKKNGISSAHPLYGPEIRALRKLKTEYPETQYVFTSERKGPMIDSTFRKMLARAGDEAKLGLPIHPHMLRHSTGFKLANEGRDTRSIQHYLGHKNIQHTVRYTEVAADRFKDFWSD
jgi:type 1 fimbriae regulatory protein FimB/type 1 fimbriae regulatory protein FimE